MYSAPYTYVYKYKHYMYVDLHISDAQILYSTKVWWKKNLTNEVQTKLWRAKLWWIDCRFHRRNIKRKRFVRKFWRITGHSSKFSTVKLLCYMVTRSVAILDIGLLASFCNICIGFTLTDIADIHTKQDVIVILDYNLV